MRVYKFLSAKFALENIEKRRLKTSEFTDMNDPYELSGGDLGFPIVWAKFTLLRNYSFFHNEF